tara:strand:+ start:553 stop:1008 length:456 start_codon:yes stop_codon:yes gene_type:complete
MTITIVECEEEFESVAGRLANLVGIPVYDYTVRHRPGGGAITSWGFAVGLTPVGLRVAFGSRPSDKKVQALIDAVVAEASILEGVPESEIREDIEYEASRNPIRFTRQIKRLSAAVREIVSSASRGQTSWRGEVRALELLLKHMGPKKHAR